MAGGYIYVVIPPNYDVRDICKLGKMYNHNFREKALEYANENPRWNFAVIFEISNHIESISKALERHLKKLKIDNEFYKQEIISKLDSLIPTYQMKYRKFTEQELNELNS